MNILAVAMFGGNTQNPKIMRILCSEWEKQGHKVIRFFPCQTKKEYDEKKTLQNVYPFILPEMSRYDNILRKLVLNRKSIISMFKVILAHPLFLIEYAIRRIPAIDYSLGKPGIVRKELLKACKKYRFDVVVVGSNPFFLAMGVARANCGLRKIWYQMDPHSDNGMVNARKINRERKAELFVYERMDRVFVQPNSYNNIISKMKKKMAERVLPTKFPLVNPDVSVDANTVHFRNNTINCVYAGALMLPIRRPDFMFKLFSVLKDTSIHLYVWCGNLTEKQKEEMLAMMPVNVTFCGSLDQVEMQRVLAGADFLVSLGNTVINQLPSKLLDYISLRKPIINIYKTETCPTREILSDYPLSISISEEEDLTKAAAAVEDFIHREYGHEMKSNQIKEAYYGYLPGTVASYVLDT